MDFHLARPRSPHQKTASIVPQGNGAKRFLKLRSHGRGFFLRLISLYPYISGLLMWPASLSIDLFISSNLYSESSTANPVR